MKDCINSDTMKQPACLFGVVALLQFLLAEACPYDCTCSAGQWDCSISLHTSISLDRDTVSLNLAFNEISVLRYDYFISSSKILLCNLTLNNNEMEKIEPEAFYMLVELQNLDLHKNQLQSLHESLFQNNLKLKTLDLSENMLKNLPSSLFELKMNLELVNIKGNNLSPSAIAPALFKDSLNAIRVEFCVKQHPYVSYLQKSLFLQQISPSKGLAKENTTISSNIDITINKSSVINFDMKLNSTSMCLCKRLSAWFWCSPEEFECNKPLTMPNMYLILNCDSQSNEAITATTKFPSTFAWTSSNYVNNTFTRLRKKLTDEPLYNTTLNTVKKVKDDTANNKYIYAGIGIIVAVSLIVLLVVILIRKCGKDVDETRDTDTNSVQFYPEPRIEVSRNVPENTLVTHSVQYSTVADSVEESRHGHHLTDVVDMQFWEDTRLDTQYSSDEKNVDGSEAEDSDASSAEKNLLPEELHYAVSDLPFNKH